MTIYISLPMHGHTEADTRERAQRAKSYIQEVLNSGFRASLKELHGLEVGAIRVQSPLDVADQLKALTARTSPRKLTDLDYLLEDLRIVATSNIVVALDGWEASRGCLAEVAFAKARGIAVVELSESLGFCRFQLGSMDRLDDVASMQCCHTVADSFITSFYRWRDIERKRKPSATRLNDYPIDDLPF